MTARELLDAKRDTILALAEDRGADRIRVFGSAARSEDDASSDIDLLVRMKSGRSLLDLVGLWLDLEETLGCKVDVVSEGGVSPYLRDKIEAEARPL